MLPSIVVSTNPDLVLDYISKHDNYGAVRTFIADEKGVGIASLRDFLKELRLSRQKECVDVYWISNADSLSDEALNSLLKPLEEAAGVWFVLSVKNIERIPSTVISRCRVVYLKEEKKITKDERWEELMTAIRQGYGECVALSDRLSDKDETWLVNILGKIKDGLRSQPTAKRIKFAKVINKTLVELKTNANKKLILDNCFFEMIKCLGLETGR